MSRIENRPSGFAGATAGVSGNVRAEPNVVEGLIDTATSIFESAVDTARQLNPIQPQIDAVTSFVNGVIDAFSVEKNVDALGPGDSYTVGFGGNGSVEGGKVYEKSEMEVKRNDDGTYTLSVNGEVGAGIYGQLGGSAGGKLSVDGEATLGVGGKVEMTFKNAADAKRAMGLLAKQAAADSVCAVGVPKQDVLSAEDRAFLNESVSAVELKGNVALQVKGSLGLADKDSSLVGGQLGLSGKAEDTLRVEYKNGKPSAIVVKQELSGEGSGNLGIGGQVGPQGSENGGGLGPSAGANVKTTVTVERRFELPEGITAEQFQQDPVGTIRNAADYAQKNQSFKITVAGEGSVQYMGNGGGKQAELTFSGKGSPEGLIGTAVKEAVNGDLSEAMRRAGDQVQVEYTQRNFTLTGFSAAPEIKIMGVGAGLEVKGQRKDVSDPTVTYKGTGTEAAEAFAEQAKKVPLERAPLAAVSAATFQRSAIVG